MRGSLTDAIYWEDENEIRRFIDAGADVKTAIEPFGTPLRHAYEQSNNKCSLLLIDAGANPHDCGLLTKYIPNRWYDFFNSRNSARSYAILAMHATHKTYGKDVARIIARVIWELRGNCAAISAKKIKV